MRYATIKLLEVLSKMINMDEQGKYRKKIIQNPKLVIVTLTLIERNLKQVTQYIRKGANIYSGKILNY